MKIDTPATAMERAAMCDKFLTATSALTLIAIRTSEGEERAEILRSLFAVTNQIAAKLGADPDKSLDAILASLDKKFDLGLSDTVLNADEITVKES